MDSNRLGKSAFIKSYNSLSQLMKTKPFDAISTREIAENAGFSRQYFYRFYKDKMDLVYDVFLRDISASMEDFYAQGKTSQKILDRLLSHGRFYKSIFESSYAGEAYRMFLFCGEMFVKSIAHNALVNKLDRDRAITLRFFMYGVVNTVIEAIQSGKTDSREMCRLFYNNLPRSLEYLKHEIVTGGIILHRLEKYKDSQRQRGK